MLGLCRQRRERRLGATALSWLVRRMGCSGTGARRSYARGGAGAG